MKRCLSFIFIFSVIRVVANSGDSLLLKQLKTRLRFGIAISPDHCFRTYENHDGTAQTASIISMYEAIDRYSIGYSGGMNCLFRLNDHFTLEGGLYVVNRGYRTLRMTILYFNNPPPDPVLYSHLRYDYYYLDLPVIADLSLGKGKFKMLINAGLTTSLFMREVTTAYNEYAAGKKEQDRNVNTPDNYRFVQLEPTASAGFSYEFSPKLVVRLTSTYKYALFNIVKETTPAYIHLWSVGTNVGVYTSF